MTIWPDKQIVGPGGASVNRPDVVPPEEVRERIDADQEELYGYPGEVVNGAPTEEPPQDDGGVLGARAVERSTEPDTHGEASIDREVRPLSPSDAAPVAPPSDQGPYHFSCGCCWWVGSVACSIEHGIDGPIVHAHPEDAPQKEGK